MLRSLLTIMVLGSFLLPRPIQADDAPQSHAGASQVVAADQLLRIDYIGIVESQPVDHRGDGHAPKTPDGTVYLRVGLDGYARFPLTERRLPFAELELPVLEAMLTTHLHLHGHMEAKVTATLQPIPKSLVTVLGQVAKPGVYVLPADATLSDAISAAGGVATGASGGRKVTDSTNPADLQPSPAFPSDGLTDSPDAAALSPQSTPESNRLKRAMRLVIRHPHIDLTQLGCKSDAEGLLHVGDADWDRVRMCIDRIILTAEEAPKVEPTRNEEFFRPL